MRSIFSLFFDIFFWEWHQIFAVLSFPFLFGSPKVVENWCIHFLYTPSFFSSRVGGKLIYSFFGIDTFFCSLSKWEAELFIFFVELSITKKSPYGAYYVIKHAALTLRRDDQKMYQNLRKYCWYGACKIPLLFLKILHPTQSGGHRFIMYMRASPTFFRLPW